MSGQRYGSPLAHARMAQGLCPECGKAARMHSGDPRFWVRDPLGCSLLPRGVIERVNQYRADRAAEAGP